MGRGKIEIKRIENSTNRQVTYSKRRAGIIKKAQELTVLCDAQVSLIMFSSTNKISEYTSPSITRKAFYDKYQQVAGVNLWQTHYEKMQDHLHRLKETNSKLRREIRQRNGEELDGLTFHQLRGLEQNMEKACDRVRNRKFHVISTQTDTYKKKVKHLEEAHNDLFSEVKAREADCHYTLVEQEGGEYQSTITLTNGSPAVFSFRLQPSQPNLHDDQGYASYGLSLS
uniref:MADS transcription factor AP3-2 n=1 Tax=Nigella integrifolia TaxID=2982723 RepID=A0A977TII3_9MAGN|nr:MADS transcription factor AP3-2 [Nigella integrifolia]